MVDVDDVILQTSATAELYHTNLLRVQAKELLSESILHLSSHTGELAKEVKWADDVRNYIDSVKQILMDMGGCILSPDTALLTPLSENHEIELKNQRYWIQFQSDLAWKHFQSKDKSTDKWEFRFPGGSSFDIHPVYSYAAHGAGLTTKAANAHVIPTIDLAVLMPVTEDENMPDGKGFIMEKDFLNGRYFDKRNLLALHIAKYLSQKKQRKTIGSAHIMHQYDGDYRRVTVLLSPPTSSQSSADGHHNSKKQKLDQPKRAHNRYRIRLILGTQHHSASDMSVGWIPRPRLFPNRHNNRFSPELQKILVGSDAAPTALYTSSIVEDMHHLKITEILAHTAQDGGTSFTDSWALIKIWCLQRGLLRGEDTLTDTQLGLILTYLYRTKTITPRMDCIQIFTLWLKFMADTNWLGQINRSKSTSQVGKDTIRHSESEGYRTMFSDNFSDDKVALVMPTDMNVSEKQTIAECIQNRLYISDYKETKTRLSKSQGESSVIKVPETLLQCFKVSTEGPVLLDSTMTFNYLSRLSSAFVRLLQIEAKKSLRCIHNHSHQDFNINYGGFDPFRHLFLEHMRFWRAHDMYIKVKLNEMDFPHQAHALWGWDVYDVGVYDAMKRGLMKILREALSDRITCMRVLTLGNGEISEKTLARQRENDKGDLGVKRLLDSNQCEAVPIRYSNENKDSFQGYKFGEISSLVSCGSYPNDYIVLGIRVDPSTCHRIIDRGPPAEDSMASASFVKLWGEGKAQLRRFKDGAIVHAALWNNGGVIEENVAKYEGEGKLGGIVETIVRHIIRLHFCDSRKHQLTIECALRDMQGLVLGAACDQKSESRYFSDPNALFNEIMSSFESLSTYLKENSKCNGSVSALGLPLPIDSVEPLSECLRYSELFPPLPHPSLGSKHSVLSNKARTSGAIMGEPILVQIRFENSSIWPTERSAIEASKIAMLMQLAKGIEKMKENGLDQAQYFGGPVHVFKDHICIGYRGFVWKIILKIEHEMKLLETLNGSIGSIPQYKHLFNRHILSLKHHFMIHGVLSKYPVAGPAVRLAKRWVAAHMLSALIPNEAIELIVTSVFINPLPFDPPGTLSCAFMRFLHLLGSYNWTRYPLLVDPNGDMSIDDRRKINKFFEDARSTPNAGPSMYIVSISECQYVGNSKLDLHDQLWKPIFTRIHPERVVLQRVSALAKRSFEFLLDQTSSGKLSLSWSPVFQETQASLMSFNSLFRINEELIVDSSCSSMTCEYSSTVSDEGQLSTPYTKAMERRFYGPKALQFKNYRNLPGRKESILYSWNPIETLMSTITKRYGHLAIFFYNHLTPHVIAVLWRPCISSPSTFSAMTSEFKQPIDSNVENDTLVVANTDEIQREIHWILRHAVINLKILNRP